MRRQSAIDIFGKGRRQPPACVLKVRRAVLTKVPHFRALRFLVLKRGLTLRTSTLRLRHTSAARHLDVAHGSIGAEMSSDREIIDDTNKGLVFHFLR
jgi:hypothetical protein